MGIISGSGSFRGRFGDHFRVVDHFGVGIISGAVYNAIYWISHYPADSVVCFVNTYPLDSDLSGL